MAKFVTFEGIEGTGKTSHVKAISKHYRQNGLKVLATREPGGTELGNELRTLLLPQRNEALNPLAELFLLAAARAQHVSHVLKKALMECELVLSDRFTDSTLAYQGGGRGLPKEFLNQVNQHAAQGIVPNLTVLLDMDPEKAVERALYRMSQNKSQPEDRFEHEELEFHRRTREYYLQLAQKEPSRFFVINAASPHKDVQQKIIEKIDTLF